MNDFHYAVNPYSKYPILQINDHIGFDDDIRGEDGEIIEKGDGQGIDGNQFAKELFELDSYNPDMIVIYVNSMGGDVKDGYEIFNAIAEVKTKTKVIISGFAYSTAGWCILSADIIEIRDYASWMCHLPYNPKSEEERSPFLEIVAKSVAIILSEKSGKPIEEVKAMMLVKTYYDAEKTEKFGLAKKVPSISNKYVVNNSGELKVVYREYQKAFNKFIEVEKKTKTMSFEKVVNRLKLADGSDENSIIAEIARRENEYIALNREKVSLEEKLTASNESKEEMEKRMKEMQNVKNDDMQALDQAKNKLDAMCAENTANKEKVEKFEKEVAENATNLAKEKATNLVRKYVDAGKIKDDQDTIKVWEDQAVMNYDFVSAQLEAIPTNLVVPKPQVTSTKNSIDVVPGSFQHFAASNREKLSEAEKKMKEKLASVNA